MQNHNNNNNPTIGISFCPQVQGFPAAPIPGGDSCYFVFLYWCQRRAGGVGKFVVQSGFNPKTILNTLDEAMV